MFWTNWRFFFFHPKKKEEKVCILLYFMDFISFDIFIIWFLDSAGSHLTRPSKLYPPGATQSHSSHLTSPFQHLRQAVQRESRRTERVRESEKRKCKFIPVQSWVFKDAFWNAHMKLWDWGSINYNWNQMRGVFTSQLTGQRRIWTQSAHLGL